MSAVASPALHLAPVRRDPERPIPRLVRAAVRGDARAWATLISHTNPIVRRAAAGFKLSPADIDDVAQITWMRAYDRLHTLREPEAFVSWIVVTARREALRLLQRQSPEILVDDFSYLDEPGGSCAEDPVIERERAGAVHAAVERLPEHQRRLLRWMLEHPGACYADVSAALNMPIGSIGPTRERALARLRCDLQLVAVAAA